jgi:hypothetical protein
MSRHTTNTSKFEIVLGVDRPLNHVFASVFDRKGEDAKGFDPFSWFAPTSAGVEDAIKAVEGFTKSKLPESIREALLADLMAMQEGQSINYSKTHGAALFGFA